MKEKIKKVSKWYLKDGYKYMYGIVIGELIATIAIILANNKGV